MCWSVYIGHLFQKYEVVTRFLEPVDLLKHSKKNPLCLWMCCFRTWKYSSFFFFASVQILYQPQIFSFFLFVCLQKDKLVLQSLQIYSEGASLVLYSVKCSHFVASANFIYTWRHFTTTKYSWKKTVMKYKSILLLISTNDLHKLMQNIFLWNTFHLSCDFVFFNLSYTLFLSEPYRTTSVITWQSWSASCYFPIILL